MPMRIQVGISACLAGHRVRYDGRDQRSALLERELAPLFELIPLCPEVGAGMAVPRPPIQIIQGRAGLRVCEVDHHTHDVTEQLLCYAQSAIEQWGSELGGFVFKSRSPSCGIDDTPWFDEPGVQQLSVGAGLFAGMLMERFPQLPVIDERRLELPGQCEAFIRRVREYDACRVSG
ncbi:MAG: DUF523 domain-containing protein [Pseudomonadota bacterium]